MNLSVVIDMNLSPEWVAALHEKGVKAIHWSAIGDPRASDQKIMAWAVTNQAIVFTHDLDFGTILAITQASKPSVIQVRTQDTLPEQLTELVYTVLTKYEEELQQGALIVVNEQAQRVRLLPLQR